MFLDCLHILWQNLSIKDSLRLEYDVLYNGTSLLRTTVEVYNETPHPFEE